MRKKNRADLMNQLNSSADGRADKYKDLKQRQKDIQAKKEAELNAIRQKEIEEMLTNKAVFLKDIQKINYK